MTISITIDIHPDRGSEASQLDEAMKALGFARAKPGYEMKRVVTGDVQVDHSTMVEEARDAGGMTQLDRVVEGAEAAGDQFLAGIMAKTEARAAAPTRERGKPSAGHARRTKAEIAEDDAAAKTGIEIISQTGVVAEEIPLISTGEERLSPEDTPEDAAADAADEAAETAATKTDKLTVEDVRRTMGLYVNRYGMAAAQVDGQEVFKRVIGESTMVDDKGNPRGWRASDLPDDQAVLAKMVSGFEEMTSKNPFNRDVVEKVA